VRIYVLTFVALFENLTQMIVYLKENIGIGKRQTAVSVFYPWLSLTLCSKAMGSLTGTVLRKRKDENLNLLYVFIAISYPILLMLMGFKFSLIMNKDEPEQLT